MTNITAMGAVGAMGTDSQWWGYEKTLTNTTTELCDYHNQHHRLCQHHKQPPTSLQCYQPHCRYMNIMSPTAELYEDRLHPFHRKTHNMLTTTEVDEHYHLDPCTVTWIPQPPTLQLYEYDHNQSRWKALSSWRWCLWEDGNLASTTHRHKKSIGSLFFIWQVFFSCASSIY